MFKKGEKVFVSSPIESRDKFNTAYGAVIRVIPSVLRIDKQKNLSDEVVVLFELFNGERDIQQSFNETELKHDNRSSKHDGRPEWERERRVKKGSWFSRNRSNSQGSWTGSHITKDN